MKTLITILILIVILFVGCAPNSIGAGAMFIDLDSRAGNVRGVTPMVFGIWDIDK